MDWTKPPQDSPRKAQLQDKGFQLSYYKLSHRRRFWRTVSMLVLIPIICTFKDIEGYPGSVWALFSLALMLVQGTYEYIRWQQDKRNGLYE